MKQHNSTLPRPHLAETLGAANTVLKTGARRVRSGALTFVNRMQIARMESVLRSMTDAQLAAIELKRSEIPDRARQLVAYRYDGL